MVITKRIKLIISEEIDCDLERFIDIQLEVSNYFLEKIQECDSTSLFIIHRSYYNEAKLKYKTGSDLIVKAMNRAIGQVRISKKLNKPIGTFTSRILIVKNAFIHGENITLPLGDRKKRLVKWCGEPIKDQKITTLTIKKIKEEWYGFLPVKVIDKKIKNYKRFMGVDLGVSKIAVITDWNGNNTKFFRGEPLRFVKNHYRELRKSMQQNIKKGNTYKAINNIRSKESQWVQDMNHKISREIVDMAVKNKRSIALEKLTGITERLSFNKKTNNMIRNWSFNQLAGFIKYKANMVGIRVVEVDPRGTSKTCSKCGHCSRSNRRTQERFKCRACGYESNADRNAAINIAKRGTELLASH